MASSIENIKFATEIVDPLRVGLPESIQLNSSIWFTAYLLVEPAAQGVVDPESPDFTDQAKQTIRSVTSWSLHHERADMVLNSGDTTALGIIANACRQARAYSLRKESDAQEEATEIIDVLDADFERGARSIVRHQFGDV